MEGGCALVWVEGPDAARFLQGLLSNDVLGLLAGESRYALLLDRKGRIQCDVRVLREGADAFTLVVDTWLADGLTAVLEGYHFSEDLDLTGPEPFGLLTVGGLAPPTARGVADIILPGRVPGTIDLVGADAQAMRVALALPAAPAEALEARRIEAGVPRVGAEIAETTLVQEVGLQDVAVSFDKGCYLGQETVARTAYRGRVNRLLRGLELPKPVVPGAALSLDGKLVGRLTSSAVSPRLGPIGMAVMSRAAEPGAQIVVEDEDGLATVRALPFA